MFRLAAEDATWTHPVTVPVPVGGGIVERRVYTAHFRLLAASRIEELAREGDRSLLSEVLVGWDEIERRGRGAARVQRGGARTAPRHPALRPRHRRRSTCASRRGSRKKFRGAARHLLSGSGADFTVHPSCWDAVRLLCASGTQWRIAPSGRLLGLDYAGVQAAARALRIRWGGAFGGLRVMEREILAAASAGRRVSQGWGRSALQIAASRPHTAFTTAHVPASAMSASDPSTPRDETAHHIAPTKAATMARPIAMSMRAVFTGGV